MKIRLRRRDRDIILLVFALLIVAVLWSTLWFLAQIILFVVVVYVIYRLLRAYI